MCVRCRVLISICSFVPRTAVAYFSQDESQNDEEKEGDWSQLDTQKKRRYRKMRQEVSPFASSDSLDRR